MSGRTRSSYYEGADPAAGPDGAPSEKLQVADGSTFAPGLRLLPTAVRSDVHGLYRVLRALDDLVDEDDPRAARRVGAVERWARHERVSETPETLVLTGIARRHPLSRGALIAFCEGMRHDIARAVVRTEHDLERYCQQAGGSVGVMLANLLGGRGRVVERKMAMLGRAMQRTNILRDIDEDRACGRLYIPQSSIERYGPPDPGAREQLLRHHIARADRLYDQGAAAICMLRTGSGAMALSVALYREILRQIERDGFGRAPGRAAVPDWRKNEIVANFRRSVGARGK